MKRYLILIFLIFVTPLTLSASLYQIDFQQGTLSESEVESQFKGLRKLMVQAMHSGLGESMNVDLIDYGFHLAYIPFKQEGVLTESSNNYLAMPFTYFGVSLWDITAFVRLGVVPGDSGQGVAPSFLIGGGLAYNIKMNIEGLPPLVIEPALTYHNSINFASINYVHSIGLHGQARLEMGEFNPYINLGFTFNYFDTNIALNNNTFYRDSILYLHGGFGVRVLFLFYQFDFLPSEAHSFGLALRF